MIRDVLLHGYMFSASGAYNYSMELFLRKTPIHLNKSAFGEKLTAVYMTGIKSLQPSIRQNNFERKNGLHEMRKNPGMAQNE